MRVRVATEVRGNRLCLYFSSPRTVTENLVEPPACQKGPATGP
jgi:hypothetical protein